MALRLLNHCLFQVDTVDDPQPSTKDVVDTEDLSSTQDETDVSSVLFNVNERARRKNNNLSPQETTSSRPIPLVPFVSIDIDRKASSSTAEYAAHTQRSGIPLVVRCDQSASHVGSEVLDATDPLVYGSLDATSWTLAEAAHRFFLILQEHVAGKDVEDKLVACIDEFPETCQVKYPYKGHALYPLTIFSATGCVRGAKAAYQAFSESIGMESSPNGLPLHVAAANDRAEAAGFLKNAYPDALAVGNQRDGQTPLHLACRYGSKDTIQVMITPTALQSMDKKGLYPVHRLCENPAADPQSFDILVNASTLVATSVTMDLRNPLHIAAKSGNVALLERVIAAAPENARATDGCLQVPLHVAAAANQRQSVECLTGILPAAIHAIDESGNRPRDLTSDPWIRSLCSRYHSKRKETQAPLVDSL